MPIMVPFLVVDLKIELHETYHFKVNYANMCN